MAFRPNLVRLLPRIVQCLALLVACPARAVTLHSGDLVLVTGVQQYLGVHHVYRLDPATLDTTTICGPGLLSLANSVAVDPHGQVLVADANAGIVRIDPLTGAQSVIVTVAQLGGGKPFGVCAPANDVVYVTVNLGAARVLRLTPSTHALATVTDGGLLTDPAGLTMGPDGQLYVCEMSSPANNGGSGQPGRGSIVRVDPVTGSQFQVAADSLFHGPFQIAFSGPTTIWTAQVGWLSSRHDAGFRVTNLADGTSAPGAPGHTYSMGLAANDAGTVYASDCITSSYTCYVPYAWILPAGPQVSLGGALAVAPQLPTPALGASWGRVKAAYR